MGWNRFTVFFALTALAFTVAFFLVRRVEKPKAASLEEWLRDILIASPQKFWLRLWPRG